METVVVEAAQECAEGEPRMCRWDGRLRGVVAERWSKVHGRGGRTS